jgi:hypothetical protein
MRETALPQASSWPMAVSSKSRSRAEKRTHSPLVHALLLGESNRFAGIDRPRCEGWIPSKPGRAGMTVALYTGVIPYTHTQRPAFLL